MDSAGRWRVLRLHVEDGIPLAVLARETGVGLRTLSRWHARYRALGRDELIFVLTRHWKRLGHDLDPDDFTDAQAIATIERITRGNFRLLERLFPQIRRVLKINDLHTITDDVIEAAASTLVIGN